MDLRVVALVALGLGLGSCSAPDKAPLPSEPASEPTQAARPALEATPVPAPGPAAPTASNRRNPPGSPPVAEAPPPSPEIGSPVDYPGAKKWGSFPDQRTDGKDAIIDTMMRTTSDPLDKVADFYEQAMGVHVAGTQPDQRILTGSTPGGTLMAVTLKRNRGVTEITVVVSKPRG